MSFLGSLAAPLLGGALGYGIGSSMGGGGGGVTGQRVERVETLTPQQKTLLNQLTGAINVGGRGPVYPGQMVPGVSPIQQGAFGMAGQIPGMTQQAMAPYDPQQTAQMFEPIAQQARMGFEQITDPAIMGRFAQMGAGSAASSAAAGEMGRARAGLEASLAGQQAGLGFGAQQAAFGRQMQAPGVAAGMANIGAVQRGITGEQLGEPYAKWQMGQPWQDPSMQFMNLALGTPGYANIGFQGFRQPSIMESLIPAGGYMAGQYLGKG